MALSEDQREVRRLRKALRDLTVQVDAVLAHLDRVMGERSTVDRGKNVAAICNHLNLHNDMAKRFGLNKK